MFIGEHRIKGSRCPFHLIADRLQYTSLLGTCERSGLCALRIGHLEQCFLSHSSLPSSFAYSPLPAAYWQEERPICSQALRRPFLAVICLFWCRGPESDWGHRDFQSRALPTELPRRDDYVHFPWPIFILAHQGRLRNF